MKKILFSILIFVGGFFLAGEPQGAFTARSGGSSPDISVIGRAPGPPGGGGGTAPGIPTIPGPPGGGGGTAPGIRTQKVSIDMYTPILAGSALFFVLGFSYYNRNQKTKA